MKGRRSTALVLLAGSLATGCGEGSGNAAAPNWYTERPSLTSCGIDAEYTDDYPNVAARECFRTAYENETPSELTTLTYGDEGEALRAHFRILGPGWYEIVSEASPAPSEAADGPIDGWERYSCERFVFFDEPGADSDGTPQVNVDGECELVERSPA